MPRHHLIHICDNLEQRDGDELFEYCECGARFYMNRRGAFDFYTGYDKL